MRGVGVVRMSIHQSWLAKRLGLGLLCWGCKGVLRKRFHRKRPALFKSAQWHFHRDNAPVHNSIFVIDYFTKIGIQRYNKCIVAGGAYFEGDKSFMCALSIKVPKGKRSGNLFNDPRIRMLQHTKFIKVRMLLKIYMKYLNNNYSQFIVDCYVTKINDFVMLLTNSVFNKSVFYWIIGARVKN